MNPSPTTPLFDGLTGFELAAELGHPALRFLQVDPERVTRFFLSRLALFGLNKTKAAGVAGVSRQAINSRLRDLRTVDGLHWLACLACVPVWSLVDPSSVSVGSIPVPPQGWEDKVGALLEASEYQIKDFDLFWAHLAGKDWGREYNLDLARSTTNAPKETL